MDTKLKRFSIVLATLATVATVALGAAGFERFKDHVKIGQGTTANKVLEFDKGSGASNPKITVNGTTGVIDITSAGGGLAPVGMVAPFAGITAPTGWLLADNVAESRTTYAALFAVICPLNPAGATAVGTVNCPHGTPDASNFWKPDMRGRVVAGDDNMGGATASRVTNAGSGIVGTTLGAVGGLEGVTGVNGGSDSIAHTHEVTDHVHTMAHSHDDGDYKANIGYYSSINSWGHQRSADDGGVISFYYITGTNSESGPVTNLAHTYNATDVSGDSGASSAANTGNPVTNPQTGPMSASATVNGSTFTWSDTGSGNVQPTLILNYIIKH